MADKSDVPFLVGFLVTIVLTFVMVVLTIICLRNEPSVKCDFWEIKHPDGEVNYVKEKPLIHNSAAEYTTRWGQKIEVLGDGTRISCTRLNK